ncbi:ComF family protein [Patescibacteria group bacterium]|nr:ComF family protein [Patescibacteria group bacterium]
MPLWLEQIVEAVFPRYCLRCHEEGSLLCDDCTGHWEPPFMAGVCLACGTASLLGATCTTYHQRDMPDGMTTSFSYADPVARQLICAWKYDYDTSAKDILLRKTKRRLGLLRAVISLLKIEAIVPIPLHHRRLCERGFDQAQEIAQALASELDIPLRDILKRLRPTGKQADRTDDKRRQEMKRNPFIVRDKALNRVLLVDDVWTTGATACAATRILKKTGVETVWVYTLAKGG